MAFKFVGENMIKFMMILFSLLLAILAWFLLTKSSDLSLLFNNKNTVSFFNSNGRVYAILSSLSISSLSFDNNLVFALVLVLVSIYTAFFSMRLASLLKK